MKRAFTERTLQYLLLLFITLILNNCGKDSNPVSTTPTDSKRIVTGDPVALGSFSAGQSSSKFTVNKPGDSLNNLTIEIPENSFAEPVTINLNYEPIKSHLFGKNFNPVSPLISIDCGKDYIDKPVVLTVPVDVPDSMFVMLFSYNKATGELDALPYVYSDNKKAISLVSNFKATSNTKSIMKLGQNQIQGIGNFYYVASAISKRAIMELFISTEFNPGRDDWQFPNYGSCIAPKGHCAGQCISALWYYFNKKSLSGSLFGKYDNDLYDEPTDSLWLDDVSGYKFASVVQSDANWEVKTLGMQDIYTKHYSDDENHFRAISYAMLGNDIQPSRPQLIYVRGIYNAGRDTFAHAIICYLKANNELFFADPNYPGATGRKASIENKKWNPYNTGINASQPGVPCDVIYLMGYTNAVSTNWLRLRGAEFETKLIGKDQFPKYTLNADNDDGNFLELKNGFKKSSGDISFKFTNVINNLQLKVYSFYLKGNDTAFAVIDNKMNLSAGKYKIGLYITDNNDHWVDFRWFDIEIADNPDLYRFECTGGVPRPASLTMDGSSIDDKFKYIDVGYYPSSKGLSIKGYNDKTGSMFFCRFIIERKTGIFEFKNKKEDKDVVWSGYCYWDGDHSYDAFYIKDIQTAAVLNIQEFSTHNLKGNVSIEMADRNDNTQIHTFTVDFQCSH